MNTSDFDYALPPDRIAQVPVEPRDASRLMVVHRATEQIEHRCFRDFQEYLRPGDLLVMNQTRVIPARLHGRKAATGGSVELLLLTQRDERTWEALTRGRGLRAGVQIILATRGAPPEASPLTPHAPLTAEVLADTPSGSRIVQFSEPIGPRLAELGEVPLPPYIHHTLSDPERYQTVYGRVEGSVAASTAGLHFTADLLVDLRCIGVELAYITLNIGLDTFRPVTEEHVEDHQIHTEWCELSADVAGQINRARLEGRRVIAVGTTVVRALETAAGGMAAPAPGQTETGFDTDNLHAGQTSAEAKGSCRPPMKSCPWGAVAAYSGPTGLFIYPGYRFRAVDALVTNFHLPRSTLLMLVSAFAGRTLILRAYQEAIDQNYRFFSFGDAMLLL